MEWTEDAKLILSPLLAAAMALRSEPAPLSRLFMTVMVLSTVRDSSDSRSGETRARRMRWREQRFRREMSELPDASLRKPEWESKFMVQLLF
jgi:hypothetical protein